MLQVAQSPLTLGLADPRRLAPADPTGLVVGDQRSNRAFLAANQQLGAEWDDAAVSASDSSARQGGLQEATYLTLADTLRSTHLRGGFANQVPGGAPVEPQLLPTAAASDAFYTDSQGWTHPMQPGMQIGEVAAPDGGGPWLEQRWANGNMARSRVPGTSVAGGGGSVFSDGHGGTTPVPQGTFVDHMSDADGTEWTTLNHADGSVSRIGYSSQTLNEETGELEPTGQASAEAVEPSPEETGAATGAGQTLRVAGGVLGTVGGLVQLSSGADELRRGQTVDGVADTVGGAANTAAGVALVAGATTFAGVAGGAAAVLDGGRDVIQGLRKGDAEQTGEGAVKTAAGGAMLAGVFTLNPVLIAGGAVAYGVTSLWESRHAISDWLSHHVQEA